jgi:dihydrolipoamide dehydrogenase
MVGLREKDIPGTTPYKTGKFPFAASGKAQALGEIRGFVKILATEDGHILGGHIVGPQAAELIAQVALAMANGLSTEQFANTVCAHPTLGEAVKEAMEDTQGQAISIIKRGEK